MESIDLKRSDLTIEESRDNSTKKLLSAIKSNLKHKNNEILTTRSQQELRQSQQELIKSQKTLQNLIISQKTQQELIKSQQELIISQKKNKKHDKN